MVELLLLIQYNQITKKYPHEDQIKFSSWLERNHSAPSQIRLRLAPCGEQIQNVSAHVETISLPMNLTEFKICNSNLHPSVQTVGVISLLLLISLSVFTQRMNTEKDVEIF